MNGSNQTLEMGIKEWRKKNKNLNHKAYSDQDLQNTVFYKDQF
jgi:hypothetical protein